MAGRLAALARASDPEKNVFLNRKRVEMLQRRSSADLTPIARLDLQIELGLERLRSGESSKAIETFQEARNLIQSLPDEAHRHYRWLLYRFLGLAHLRLGEQENCVARHTSDSCLLPIQAGGIHLVSRGSQGAIDNFINALDLNRQDLSSIWLLNVAYMTLGQYPSRVPPEFRIPETVFKSEYDIGRFPDLAPQAGLASMSLAGGAIMDDFDGDGLLDVFCSSWGMTDQIRFFRNNGDGSFTDRTEPAGLTGIVGGLNLCHADYDNDGDRDVFVLRGAWLHTEGAQPNSLLRNNGDGTFDDVTDEVGLLSFHPTQTAAWGDYDLDGDLDLFIGNESDDDVKHRCELYRNNGDGTFTDVAAASGVDHAGFVKGVAWGDYDNDGRPDLYLSRLEESNLLFRNAGPGKGGEWRFEDVTSQAGVSEPRESFPTWFWDYDNDGDLDLFVASYTAESSMEKVAADYLGLANPGETPRLYQNNGDGTFSNVTAVARLNRVLVAMGINFGDLDNDGFLDFYVGTGEPLLSAVMPNRMFRNQEGKAFQDVTTSGGFGHVQKGHGIAFGDYDNDGDEDVYAVFGGAYEGDGFQNALFQNPGHGNHWVTLRLRGTRSNRDAIGARIEVRIVEGQERRSIHRVVTAGGSFGCSSLQQEIGLRKAEAIREVRIRWPVTGEVQTVTDVPMDSIVEIVEGKGGFRTR